MTGLAPWLTPALVAGVHIWTGALVQRQIDMETVPSVSAHHLRAIEAQIERECRK